MKSNMIKIGMFGLGTVGKSVFEHIEKNRSLLESRSGYHLKVTHAVVKNTRKDRGLDLSGVQVSPDSSSILDDESIDIVIELIGDTRLSETIITEALKRGKSVITANKAVLARKSHSIFNAAYESNAFLGFESSVGSGIPVIRSVREGFAGDTVSGIRGILNSTANFILSRMEQEGLSFAEILKTAQAEGLAEPDPTFDIEGYDTAHKIIVLMNLAFNKLFSYDQLTIEGISTLSPLDMNYAKKLGYTIKHFGWAENRKGLYFAAVHPVLIPLHDNMATVNDAYNAITVMTDTGGPVTLHGLGAGADAAASGVIGDLLEAVRYIETEQKKSIYPLSVQKKDLEKGIIQPLGAVSFRYYLRFTVEDVPGVLSELTSVLAESGISIKSFLQDREADASTNRIPVIVMTHKTREDKIMSALNQLKQRRFNYSDYQVIRIPGV